MQPKFPLQTHLSVINCALLLVLIILALFLSCNHWPEREGIHPTNPITNAELCKAQQDGRKFFSKKIDTGEAYSTARRVTIGDTFYIFSPKDTIKVTAPGTGWWVFGVDTPFRWQGERPDLVCDNNNGAAFRTDAVDTIPCNP
jgi:hypothetical protein